MTPFLLALTLSAAPAPGAQPPAAPAAQPPEAQQLVDAQADHMWRLTAWGAGSVVAGGALATWGLATDTPEATGFGAQTAAWGAIDLVIAGLGLGFPPAPAEDLPAAIAAEQAWAVALWVNVGLDVGYVMTGTALAVLGGLGAPAGRDLVGHGAGVATQGLALFVLDLWAVLESGPRQAALLERLEE